MTHPLAARDNSLRQVTARQVSNILRKLADPVRADHSRRFFKTGAGEYGAGDIFLGIRVPLIRGQARLFQELPLRQAQALLKSRYHEERLCALLILVQKFSEGDAEQKARIFRLYLSNTRYINNWDLVDSSAPQIVGAYLLKKNKRPVYMLSESGNLWERRIAIIASFTFIRSGRFRDAINIARRLINDEEDLIHKAVGWMLREIGNRDRDAERAFLNKHYRAMPRTMLRYAIEKFPERERKRYLSGKVMSSR